MNPFKSKLPKPFSFLCIGGYMKKLCELKHLFSSNRSLFCTLKKMKGQNQKKFIFSLSFSMVLFLDF